MEQRGIVRLEGGPCSGQRFFVWPDERTVRPVFIDFSGPVPQIKQAIYERLFSSDIAVYQGIAGETTDSCV